MKRAVLFAGLMAACGDAEVRPQLIVVIDTDAPVPRFGDRLLIEIVDEGGNTCDGCRRVVDVSDPTAWPHSFGVSDRAGAVRLRLFRARDRLADGAASPGVTLDLLGRLPRVPAGIERVRATLRMDCSGRPADVDAKTSCTDATAPGGPAPMLAPDDASPSLVNTWPGAEEIGCSGEAAADDVCIAGGATFMGDDLGQAAAGPAHLVVIRPFFVDKDEVRVGVFREFLNAFVLRHPDTTGFVANGEGCTLPIDPFDPSRDWLPVNCVSHVFATMYCESIEKRLPTEAEWEWAARSGVEERSFPWGETATPRCSEVGLARLPATYPASEPFPEFRCTFPGNAELPLPIASSPLDLSAALVRDLGGGVSEHTADGFRAYDGSCWQQTPLPDSPFCPPTRDEPRRTVRGGSWLAATGAADPTERRGIDEHEEDDHSVGFRCARDGASSAPSRPPPPATSGETVCASTPAQLWRFRDVVASSSGVFSDRHTPAWVLDGRADTAWFSDVAPDKPWIEVILPEPATVSRLEITGPPEDEESDFDMIDIILIGDDGSELYRKPGTLVDGGGARTIDPAVAGVRRVRIEGVTWQNQGSGTLDDSPGFGEVHVIGSCGEG